MAKWHYAPEVSSSVSFVTTTTTGTLTGIPGAYYVNPTSGSDTYDGTRHSPFATLDKAISASIDFHTENPTLLSQIIMSPATYNEDLVLEDDNLTDLEVKIFDNMGFAGGEGLSGVPKVVLGNLISTRDNENLKWLKVEGIQFTGSVEMSCDVSGTTNNFGTGYVHFENCTFTGNDFTGSAIGKLSYNFCQLDCPRTYTNNKLIEFLNCRALTYPTNIFNDASANGPNGFTTQVLRSRFTRFANTSASLMNGASEPIQVELYAGTNMSGVVIVGSGVTFSTNPGAYTYLWAGSYFEANSTFSLLGGSIFPDNMSIDSAATVNVWEGYETTETVKEHTLYVDDRVGNDLFNGSQKYPYATITPAITEAISVQTADADQLVKINIASKTYAEDIVLENANLNKLIFYGDKVTVQALSSSKDNENLSYLKFEGITFNSSSNLVCDVGGASSLLGNDKIVFEDCNFVNDFTGSTVGNIYNYNTNIGGGCLLRNYQSSNFTNSVITGALSIDLDNTVAIPGTTDPDCLSNFYSSRIGNTTIIRTTGSTNPKIALYEGSYISGTVDIGTNCILDVNDGNVRNVGSSAINGTLNINGGSVYDYSNISGSGNKNVDYDIQTNRINAIGNVILSGSALYDETGPMQVGTGSDYVANYVNSPGQVLFGERVEFRQNIEMSGENWAFKGGSLIYFGDLGAAWDARIGVVTQHTNDALVISSDDTSKTIYITDNDRTFTNWAQPVQANPTIFLQAADTDATHHIKFFHDQTDGNITAGSGSLKIGADRNVVFTGSFVPSSSTDIGTQGQIAFDNDHIYYCVAANSWKRTQISGSGW